MKRKKTGQSPPAPQPQYTIENCNFAGVHWDAKAVEAVQTVANALLNLTRLFESQEVKVDTMVRIGSDGPARIANSRVKL